MTDKLKGAFHGCPFHGDDYEACIQYSGTAPCSMSETGAVECTVTCFKASGKYYTEKVVRIPHMAAWELRDYLLARPDLWPVVSLQWFFTVVQPKDGVPILIKGSGVQDG